jgi:hypothetical protein
LETLSKRPHLLLDLLDTDEPLILTHGGKSIGRIEPVRGTGQEAIGMSTDREDTADPAAEIQEQRRGRFEHTFEEE